LATQQLSRSDVEQAFREIGEIMLRHRKTAEIAVYGGAAIMLQFEVTFRTADVDAVVQGGDHGVLMQAARDVAERHGWHRSWFSEAVSTYVGVAGGTALHASYPSETWPGLRVYLAKPDYLLAMKLRAMRVGSRDESDAAMLAGACGITTREAMLALLRSYFPNEPADARRSAVVGQFAETLHAPPPADPG
jgi:hypothetical protein